MIRRRIGSSSARAMGLILLFLAAITVSRLSWLSFLSYDYYHESSSSHNSRSSHLHSQIANASNGNNDNTTSLPFQGVCTEISNALDIHSWPPIIYHKDIPPRIGDKPPVPPHTSFDAAFFSSVEEDDAQGRKVVADFNRLRNAVLTPGLLEKSGFKKPDNRDRGTYAAQTFAKRFLRAREKEGRPLAISVFGSSFTIGSNCGESSTHDSTQCAWPHRLRNRWEEVVLGRMTNRTAGGPQVEWKMFQENAQASVNIAQKFPALIDEFTFHNITPDAILLDNTIMDAKFQQPWFEAVVRALIQQYPDTLIVSIVDAIPGIVDEFANKKFAQMLQNVQQHYGMATVDVANMVRVLREDMNETQSERAHDVTSILDALLHNQTEPPPPSSYNKIDLLWPQTPKHMVLSNGSHVGDREIAPFNKKHKIVYWANFVPTIRKTKVAHYPSNHPPWVTHQYVADSVLYILLRVVQMGFECSSSADLASIPALETTQSVPETTVAPKAEIESCFICTSPITRIDAKTTNSIGNATALQSDQNQINNGNSSKGSSMEEEGVIVTCGDFQWITDDRHRSGWQSDRHGSIVRFRLKVKDNQPPTISITHMKSHATFGDLLVAFRPVKKKDTHSSPLGCKDADRFKNIDVIERNELTSGRFVPSYLLKGKIQEFSRWDTMVFPGHIEYFDLIAVSPWRYLNETVLSLMQGRDANDDAFEEVKYVDVYVINLNEDSKRQRIKIQTVTSC